MAESAEGARLLSECGGKLPPRVRIPLSPPHFITYTAAQISVLLLNSGNFDWSGREDLNLRLPAPKAVVLKANN